MKKRIFKIRRKYLHISLLIEIAWLRFKILKLPPQEYIYTHPPLCFRESWPRNGLSSP